MSAARSVCRSNADTALNRSSETAIPTPTHQSIEPWSERVWMTLIGVLLLNSVLRGITPPNRWAYTQYLANYDFGFAKRSLQGAVVSALDIPALYTYSFAFWYMMSVFTANALLLLWIMRRLCATGDLNARLNTLVFASSLAVVVLAHIVGYGDEIGLLVTLLALLVRDFHHRCLLVAVLFPIAMLVQETEFVMLFPVVVFRFLVDIGDVRSAQRTKLIALGVVLAGVFGTLLVLLNTHLSEASATAMYQSIQSRSPYPLREYQVMMTSTLADNVRMVMHAYSFPWMRLYILLCWVATLPSAAYFMRQTWLHMTYRGQSLILRGAAMAASVAPLSMHLIAVDGNRFAAFTAITSFLVYATVKLQQQVADTTPVSSSASRINLLVPPILIAVNLSSSMPLFPGYVVRNFPYEELLLGLGSVLAAEEPFHPQPEQCFTVGDQCLYIYSGEPQSAVSKAKFCADKP